LGYNSWAYKYTCYILAGLFAAVAGVLYAYFNGFISPSEVGLALSGEVMLMVILGGSETLLGAAVGGLVIVLLKHFVSIYTEHWELILGMVFVLTIFYARRGIMGYLEELWLKVRR
jgi:branched-chain amino acid transport system permease protein